MTYSVEMIAKDGKYIVRVTDDVGIAESTFNCENHASSWAEGQRIRISRLKRPTVGGSYSLPHAVHER